MFQGPTPCRRPLPQNRPKMHENADPPKNTKIAPKVVPKGDPKSTKIRLKSALAAFLGPGTSKKSLREGLQKYDPFLIHSGTLKSGPNIINSSKNRGSRGPQKGPCWAPFWDPFGSPSLHYTPSGGAWGHFGGKKRDPKTTHFLMPICSPKMSQLDPQK